MRNTSWGIVGIGVVACLMTLATTSVLAQDTPTDQQSGDKTFEGVFGKTVGSDYVAKHWSLIFGMIVTDPFNFETPKPAASPSQTPAVASGASSSETPSPVPTPIFLSTNSDAKVRAFLEGQVRYRWAWLDRLGIGAVPKGDELGHACPGTKLELAKAQTSFDAAQMDRAEAEARAKVLATEPGTSATERDALKTLLANQVLSGDSRGAAATKARLAEPSSEKASKMTDLQANEAAARARLDILQERARTETKAYYRQQWQLAQQGVPVDFACGMWVRREPYRDHCGDVVIPTTTAGSGNWHWDGTWDRCLQTGDFQVRVGYVFDGGSPSGLSSLASNSNVYGDLIGGINLIRASLPTSSPDETPIRASINLEGLVSMTTDTDSVDVHGRYLIGAGFAVGVPLQLLPTKEKADTAKKADESKKDGTDATGTANAATEVRPGGIVEMVARLGAVNVDVPRFVNGTSRAVVVQNGEPDFSGEWGLGLDLEMNVPITDKAGYFTARASINEFIKPSPWGIQLGYTIPLSTLWSAVTP